MSRMKGYKHSEDTKRKIGNANRISHLGNIPWNKGLNKYNNSSMRKLSEERMGEGNPMYGRLVSEQTREKRRIKMMGHKVSKETIDKINLARKGFKHTEKSKIKIGLSGIGRVPWNKGLKNCFSKESITKMCLSQKKRFIDNPKQKGFHFTEEHKAKLKITRAKQITPTKDTKIEIKIQNFLEQLGIDYLKHKHININHSYQCDIFIPSMNLVIECDGVYWHSYPTGREIDSIRTKELLEKGFKVLRLWEFEIKAMDINQFKERLS